MIERIGGALADLPLSRAGFLVGQLYTALLPDDLRKTLGAYYTPPALVERLVTLVTESGFDWSTGRVIDPACGGAAFLASVAPNMVQALGFRSATRTLDDIEKRLMGIEVDPFAAWMSMVLLDLALLREAVDAGRRVKNVVCAGDALAAGSVDIGRFDLVIGNPPYGRITLAGSERQRFRESLFGHANLYGLFTELAVRLTKENGLIAYVTPTSFLGGEYFKNLRKFLSANAPLHRLEFVSNRQGVFNGVLQETLLAVFTRQKQRPCSAVYVNTLCADEEGPLRIDPIGKLKLAGNGGGPWVLPRSREQARLIRRFPEMQHRLSDFGFAVATGQLVWNRHKDQLRSTFEPGYYPIVWAEAVTADGKFQFQAARRTHLPYLKLRNNQQFLLNHEPCILVQRTTSKEQRRRLVAAIVPNWFVVEYPGFIVENHLNMVLPVAAKPRIGLRTMLALFNSEIVDQAFRCINGSVAVSAYELNSLPLPNPEQMKRLQTALLEGDSSSETEKLISSFYTNAHEPAAAVHSASGHRKMVEIFPEGTQHRTYLVRQIAAKTLFVMSYVGAVEDTNIWLRPDQVTKMTDQQSLRTEHGARSKWAQDSLEAGKMKSIRGRWYAPNTREPIRDETLRNGFVPVGAVIERTGLPTTSSKPRYALARDFAALLEQLAAGAQSPQRLIVAWQQQHLTHAALRRINLLRQGTVRSTGSGHVTVTFPNGETRLMQPGPSTEITKGVIEVFARRFLREPGVIFVSESGNKVVERDDALAQGIGLKLDYSRNLPDAILADVDLTAPKVVFVEVVATDGAITEQRKQALLRIALDAGCKAEHIYFVTAFRDRASPAFRRLVSEVAWGTFVWFTSEEEKLLAFREGETAELPELFKT